MNRRKFIKKSCLVCASGMGISFLLDACTNYKYVSNYDYTQNKIVLKKSEFISLKRGKEVQRKFVIIKPENLAFPIVIYPVVNEYKALLLQCTHQGCELTPYETTMVCPCHGAEFNNRGEVMQGPAELNLKSFSTTHDAERIYIEL